MESNIVINLNENGISTVCCTVNGEEIELNLTEDEEVEILRKITIILLTKLPYEEMKKHMKTFLKFV
jgi:preprotein translocase subunit SecD